MDRITKEEWWATPIWYFLADNNNINFDKIEQECYKEKSKNVQGRTLSNIFGWQSDFIYDDSNPETTKLIKYIVGKAQECISDYGVKPELKVGVDNYWININNKNGYNTAHVHDSLLSCVVYIKIPTNSGDIIFNNNPLMSYILDNACDNTKKTNISQVRHKAQEGKVIIFPSYVQHYVEPNLTDEDRISISFNFKLK